LREAWRTLQQAIQMVGTASGCLRLVIVGLAYIYVYQADLLREWNQLDKALSLALHGNQLGEQFGNALYVEQRHAVLMRIYLSRGEVDQANRVLQQFIQAQHAQHVGNPNQVAWVTSGEHVRVFLARGERGQAIRWVKELEQGERPSSLFARERQDVARARILLAQQKPGEALSLLEPWLATQAAERRDHDIEMRLLQVLAYQMRQEESLALDTLAQAVRLAEPEEYIRRFVDEGPPIAALIATLKAQDRGPIPYLDTLLAAFQPDETTSE
jgi:LuxR family maltose regulon positive regulatory protein